MKWQLEVSNGWCVIQNARLCGVHWVLNNELGSLRGWTLLGTWSSILAVSFSVFLPPKTIETYLTRPHASPVPELSLLTVSSLDHRLQVDDSAKDQSSLDVEGLPIAVTSSSTSAFMSCSSIWGTPSSTLVRHTSKVIVTFKSLTHGTQPAKPLRKCVSQSQFHSFIFIF